jgi:hypothetical protein
MGRSTKYRKELAEALPELFKDGKSVCEVCGELGISRETFYRWVDVHPRFRDTYKEGLALSQQWWEKAGRAGAIGKIPIQPAVWIYNMKNRFRHDWTDKSEIELSGEVQYHIIPAKVPEDAEDHG